MIETLESPSKRAIRVFVFTVVSQLHEVDNLLMELCEHLSLPPDVSEMWELRRPMSFLTNLHGSLEAVRRDCIHDVVEALLVAVRHDEESLRIAFVQQQVKDTEGERTAVYPLGSPNRPPA